MFEQQIQDAFSFYISYMQQLCKSCVGSNRFDLHIIYFFLHKTRHIHVINGLPGQSGLLFTGILYTYENMPIQIY